MTEVFNFLKKHFKKSIYFCLHWVFVAVRGLSLAAVIGATLDVMLGFSWQWLLSLQSTGSRHRGFRSCFTWAQWLWSMGFAALQHVESSWTRN